MATTKQEKTKVTTEQLRQYADAVLNQLHTRETLHNQEAAAALSASLNGAHRVSYSPRAKQSLELAFLLVRPKLEQDYPTVDWQRIESAGHCVRLLTKAGAI